MNRTVMNRIEPCRNIDDIYVWVQNKFLAIIRDENEKKEIL